MFTILNVHSNESSSDFEDCGRNDDITSNEIKKRCDIELFYEDYYFDEHECKYKLMEPCISCKKIMPCKDCAAECVLCHKKVCHSCNYEDLIMFIHDCSERDRPDEILWWCDDCILDCLICKTKRCIECSIQDKETTKKNDYAESFYIECCENDALDEDFDPKYPCFPLGCKDLHKDVIFVKKCLFVANILPKKHNLNSTDIRKAKINIGVLDV